MTRWIALVTFVLVAAACGDEPAVAEPPGSAAYAMVIERFLPPPPEPGDRPVVFVVPVNGDPLAIDTQVGVIDALDDVADVRFVDDPSAAVDEASSDQPPREEGTLIGLGRFSAEPPYTVRVELYDSRDEIEGHLLTLARSGTGWAVAGTETVAPEVLVGDG